MHIIYVAKHDSGGNDDEGAIVHALEVLGHRVTRVQEQRARHTRFMGGDLCLFHKWGHTLTIRQVAERMPTAFWYFDLVDFPDPTLAPRNQQRKEWMRQVIPHVHYGFCTDGDWVNNDTSGKLHHLPQGADERVVGYHDHPKTVDILFTGISRRAGVGRESFVRMMEERWGSRFVHVPTGTYREKMRELIGTTKIVVAPDAPVTDRYCSNRVFNVLGFGGILLHPRCNFLNRYFSEDEGPIWYRDRDHLNQMIESILSTFTNHDWNEIYQRAVENIWRENLYRHRCERLLEIVGEKK